MKKFTTIVENDEINYSLCLPEELLLDLQWFEGQKLTLEMQEDGSLLISKAPLEKLEEQSKELYL